MNEIVSIAMTTYNSTKYLNMQLDSLVMQSRCPNEIIIVDDASNDLTLSIINTYKNNFKNIHWKILVNKKNIGYIESFKKSISNCTGNYIFLCDHDDIWEKTKIEKMCKILQKENILCVSCSFKKIDSENKPIEGKYFFANNNLIKRKMKNNKLYKINLKEVFIYPISPGCCCCFKASYKDDIVKKILNVPHDYFIMCYFAQKKGLFFINEELVKYRIHERNTIGLNRNKTINDRLKTAREDLNIKLEIYKQLNLKKYYLSICNVMKKRIKLLEERKKYKILELAIITFFKNKYFLTLLKDYKVLNNEND